MLKVIGSANIACGFHAGDPRTMAKTVEEAVQNDIGIGAHPSFPDLVGFGRRSMNLTSWEITTDVLYQLGALNAFVKAYGGQLQHLTPHGQLGNLAASDSKCAEAIVDAVVRFDPSIIILCQPGELAEAAKKRGLRHAATIFADRAYNDNGKLVSRKEPNAVINDPDIVIKRCVRMVVERKVTTITGRDLTINGNALLLHGDTAGSLDLARKIRSALIEAGVEICKLSKQLA